MNLLIKNVFIVTVIVLLSACDNSDSEKTIDGSTVVIGKFKLIGNAASGQYALKLHKLDRFIADRFSQVSGWKILELERLGEMGSEKRPIFEDSSKVDELFKGMYDSAIDKVADELSVQLKPVKQSVNIDLQSQFPGADFILVGEMNGFSFDIDRNAKLTKGIDGSQVVKRLVSRSRIAKTSVSIRIINVTTREIIFTKRVNVRSSVAEDGDAESQINLVLENIASRIVAESLISFAGNIQVAAINADDTLLLNRGSLNGLEDNMEFELYRQGEWVTDPATGEKISRTRSSIGKIVIQSTQEKTSIAKFVGDTLPKIADLAVFDNEKFTKESKGISKIRVAIGTTLFTGDSVAMPTPVSQQLVGTQIEHGLSAKLDGKSGIKVVNQHKSQINEMLAQQMLSDLNQGREPALPLGTLKGVDYLVFTSVVQLKLKAPVKKMEYIEVLGESVETVKEGEAHIKAYVYMQDVNTGENVSGTIDVDVDKVFNKDVNISDMVSAIVQQFLQTAAPKLINNLRPLEVYASNNGVIMLSQGAGVVNIGDELAVYSKGEAIIDPYTGERIENIGSVEISRIRVTALPPNGLSIATLLSGESPRVGMSVSIVNKVLSIKDDCNSNSNCISQEDKVQAPIKTLEYNW